MSVLRPDLMMKCVVPVIMAGIIAVSQPSLSSAACLRCVGISYTVYAHYLTL